jgi:hypothetical protein
MVRLVTPDIGASTIGGQTSSGPIRSGGTVRVTTKESTTLGAPYAQPGCDRR